MNNQQTTLIQQHSKYKIILLGDSTVGKTCLVQQIISGAIKTPYQPTIYLDSAKKIITHNNRLYKLMLWDTAGEEKYHSIIPSFIRGAQCVIILYDVTKSNTFANCEKWLNMLKSMKSDKGQRSYSLILVGNKIDLERVVEYKDGFEFGIKNGMDYIQISSKTGEGVQNLISIIVDSIQKIKNKSERETKQSQSETTHKIFLSKKDINNQLKLKIKNNYFNCCCFL